ncbi:MAG: M2 family metallopeptidase [Polyangiaceae bacterium]
MRKLNLSGTPGATAFLALVVAACTTTGTPENPKAEPVTVEGAKAFVKDLNEGLRKVYVANQRADWINQTYITEDTDALAGDAKDATMAYVTAKIKESVAYRNLDGLPPDIARQLELLRRGTDLPAPADPAERKELANLTVEMDSMYGKGKYCSTSLARFGAEAREAERAYKEALTKWQAEEDRLNKLDEEAKNKDPKKKGPDAKGKDAKGPDAKGKDAKGKDDKKPDAKGAPAEPHNPPPKAPPPPSGQACLSLGELSKVLEDPNAKWDELVEAWRGWRTISVPMRAKYERFVELANKGARDIGFADLGDLWKSRYDMTPDELEADVERLWQQVKPLYDDLHCYARRKLAERWGEDKVPAGKPIQAQLFGNMWSQTWGNIYDTLEPYKGEASLDISKGLAEKHADAKWMMKTGESFFTSLGLRPLPDTFWQRSLFEQPRDREVVCHASAWDLTFAGDVRVKMCTEINEEDLITIHHELGHDYYFMYYNQQPVLFQDGANDGFHEGIGDTLALSVTPEYLVKIGLLSEAPKNEKAELNVLMRRALDKVAFLPFGLMIDKWRWDVFKGKIKPSEYNKAWWEGIRHYQGIVPPMERTEGEFDPGAKYHVPANVPYLRYFLADIYQFQFHRALCKESGFKGPLNKCSIYGSKAAGQKLAAMLSMGASKPWPEAMKAISGETAADAGALIEYFQPLWTWLKEQNKGQKCGW